MLVVGSFLDFNLMFYLFSMHTRRGVEIMKKDAAPSDSWCKKEHT